MSTTSNNILDPTADEQYDALLAAVEKLDWSVHSLRGLGFVVPDGKIQLEFEKYSPAGVDFNFCAEGATLRELVEDVELYARDFDEDEHVRLHDKGRGAPSLKELVEDASKIHAMLEELAEALRAAIDGIYEEPHGGTNNAANLVDYRVGIRVTGRAFITVRVPEGDFDKALALANEAFCGFDIGDLECVDGEDVIVEDAYGNTVKEFKEE